jgi:hypothetical protein
MDLSNRVVAVLIWLAAFAAFVLGRRDTRESVVGVLRALWGKLAVLFVAYAIYVAVVVTIAHSLGAWNVGLLKETIAWFLIPGLVLLFGFTKAYEGRGYYGRTLVRVIGLTALVEFYVNLAAFPLWAELLLLPLVVLLGALSVVAGLKPETLIAKRFVDRVLAFVGLVIIVGTAAYVVREWQNMDKGDLALSFALPIWLTAASLPFIFLFSLYANYETIFVRIDLATMYDKSTRRRAKAALVASYHVRNRELHHFAGQGPQELAKSKSWGEARRIIAFYRAEARVEEAKMDLVAKRLARYAGVKGTDWEGHPLDQREFEETKKALDRLAMFQRSQHQQQGRYNPDLSVGTLVAENLPPEHGIVLKVNRKGSAWFAWRRMVSGWCLGIGASGAPSDHWTYGASEPPGGYPKKDTNWHQEGH